MFDPEKVRNYTANNIQFSNEPAGTHWVKASDYDQLLVRYRKSKDSQVSLVAQIKKCVDANITRGGGLHALSQDFGQCKICGDIMHQTYQHSMYQPR